LVSIYSSLALSSCDVDIFGLTWKQLAGGYRLVQSEVPHECGIIAPGDSGGPMATEIGWRKPLIIYRARNADHWNVIDTVTHRQTSISLTERTTNPAYRDIATYQADDAWRQLSRYRQQW
jgi:hypothetical protein